MFHSRITVSVYSQLYYIKMRDLMVKKIADIYAQIFYLVIVTSLNSISFFLARIQTQKKKFLKYNAHISNESQAFKGLLFF